MQQRSFLILGSCMLLALSSRAAETPPTPDYHPSLADLMNIGVQPRHIKLGLAGQYQNWPYAAYELSELRNAFVRIGRTIPVFRETDIAAQLTAMTQAPMTELDAAIKANDAARFRQAYDQLTNTCNACHHVYERSMIVIKHPDAEAYPDQEFRPEKK